MTVDNSQMPQKVSRLEVLLQHSFVIQLLSRMAAVMHSICLVAVYLF